MPLRGRGLVAHPLISAWKWIMFTIRPHSVQEVRWCAVFGCGAREGAAACGGVTTSVNRPTAGVAHGTRELVIPHKDWVGRLSLVSRNDRGPSVSPFGSALERALRAYQLRLSSSPGADQGDEP